MGRKLGRQLKLRPMKYLANKNIGSSRFSLANLSIFSILFAVIGAYILYNAFAATLDMRITSLATGYTSPVDISNTGVVGDDRLFIIEQRGNIKIVHTTGVKVTTPFLNITSRVNSSGGSGEDGLLGLVFHPNYSSNRYFYVSYTIGNQSLNVSRFTRDATNPDLADPNSEVILLNVPHPGQSNHNGGDLHFGPDGFLYITTGDGGGGGDTSNNAQNNTTLLGKMLRVDVNNGTPYSIPATNPFAGSATNKKEIWATGLRNPWRFSFDRLTGDLWIGDVGQNAREEVDLQLAGASGGVNYGWRCYEGNSAYNTSGCQAQSFYKSPVGEYDHGSGRCAVTGGYVYRGTRYPAMTGRYFFSDYCSGHLYSLIPNGSGGWTQELLTQFAINPSAFGEDVNGEIYISDLNGGIYHLETTTQLNDTVNPTASVTAPANGATVSGATSITATASDNIAVTKVEFLVDGTVKGTDTSSPYSYSWDTNGVANGSHSISVKAYDAAGNIGISSNVALTTSNAAPNPIPSPWRNSDIGLVGTWGSATASNNIFTIKGAGADIGGTDDAFHFVYQPLNGDGQISARIASMQNTDSSAKAGLMVRDNLNSDAIQFSLLATPTAAGGLVFETRTSTHASTTVSQASGNITVPYWLRLQRQSNNVTAYWSADGINWQHIITSSLALSLNTQIGMAVSSHNVATLNTSTFDNIDVDLGGNSPPLNDITYPDHSGVFGGLITVTTNVSDSDGINRVEFSVDGILKSTDTTSPYTYSWDTTTYSNGNHTLETKAYDSLGNYSIHTHIVNLQNGSSAPKQGDINGDNIVNITDLSLLLSSYGQTTIQCITDNRYKCDLSIPSDNLVNIFDLSTLLSNYGV